MGEIPLSKLKKVKVKMMHNIEKEYTCIDLGDGVWRKNGNVYQAHTFILVGNRNSPYTPEWKDVVSEESYIDCEIKDYFPGTDSE